MHGMMAWVQERTLNKCNHVFAFPLCCKLH